MVNQKPPLVLWDIDKTLVDIGGISREIYASAFESVTGFRVQVLPNMAGKTDHDLILASLRLHDVPGPERYLERFYAALTEATLARVDEIRQRGRRLAGAYEAVRHLAIAPGVMQSVVTGNVRAVARIKLAAFDLADHIDFDIGGYGSDDRDRAHLVRLALERAHAKFQTDWARDRVFVIGDTPHDIAGAKANGVKAIGVASGSSTMDALKLADADAVLESLEDTQALMNLLLS